MMAPLKNNCFEIVLFSFWTLKTASQKQHYLCQKFLLSIPKQTWKIFSIARLIYFLRPHMAICSRLTPTNVAKWRVSRNSVYHYFLLLLCSHSIQGTWKMASVLPFNLTVGKKEHPLSHSTLPFENKLYLFSRSTVLFEKDLHPFSCSKKNCICSAIKPICFERLL